MKTIHVADHFCGAVGTSAVVAEACQVLGLNVDLLKQIGNAVPPIMGKVLASALLQEYVTSSRTGQIIELSQMEVLEVKA